MRIGTLIRCGDNTKVGENLGGDLPIPLSLNEEYNRQLKIAQNIIWKQQTGKN